MPWFLILKQTHGIVLTLIISMIKEQDGNLYNSSKVSILPFQEMF